MMSYYAVNEIFEIQSIFKKSIKLTRLYVGNLNYKDLLLQPRNFNNYMISKFQVYHTSYVYFCYVK